MSTTIQEVRGFLDECDLKYQLDEDSNAIHLGFGSDPETTTYRDQDGDPFLRIVVRVVEKGEFLTVFAPYAWTISDSVSQALVFEAALAFQMRYKMLRLDYDPEDGELRPNIELPLETSTLTSRQFHRVLHGLLHGVQQFDKVMRHVLEMGEVNLDCLDDEPPASPAADAALQALADRAGGADELERLVGGSEPGPEEHA